jgi:hypothetical protein
VPPVTADTEPPPQAKRGRAGELRQAAREHTGLPHDKRRQLLGETATADSEPSTSTAAPVPDLVGRNTFLAYQPEWSHETSNEDSNEVRNDSDDSPEHAPLNTAYAHVDDGVEDRWTGTD